MGGGVHPTGGHTPLAAWPKNGWWVMKKMKDITMGCGTCRGKGGGERFGKENGDRYPPQLVAIPI